MRVRDVPFFGVSFFKQKINFGVSFLVKSVSKPGRGRLGLRTSGEVALKNMKSFPARSQILKVGYTVPK